MDSKSWLFPKGIDAVTCAKLFTRDVPAINLLGVTQVVNTVVAPLPLGGVWYHEDALKPFIKGYALRYLRGGVAPLTALPDLYRTERAVSPIGLFEGKLSAYSGYLTREKGYTELVVVTPYITRLRAYILGAFHYTDAWTAEALATALVVGLYHPKAARQIWVQHLTGMLLGKDLALPTAFDTAASGTLLAMLDYIEADAGRQGTTYDSGLLHLLRTCLQNNFQISAKWLLHQF
jgi:hypothetical protein